MSASAIKQNTHFTTAGKTFEVITEADHHGCCYVQSCAQRSLRRAPELIQMKAADIAALIAVEEARKAAITERVLRMRSRNRRDDKDPRAQRLSPRYNLHHHMPSTVMMRTA